MSRMSFRKWNLGHLVLILFFIFAALLLQFFFSSLRIRALVEPLDAGKPAGEGTRHIVLISQERDNPFWQSIEQGAREASRQYGMELENVGPFRVNPAEQFKLLEKTIAAKADGILVQGINDPKYRQLIDKAAGQGIPVITVDTDEPGSRRLSYAGTDNTEAGKRMGELIVQASGGKGSIGVLVGGEDADNQRLRLEGFRSVVSRYPGLAIADIRSSTSRLQAAQQAEDMRTVHPEIGFMVGFSAFDGLGILDAAGRSDSGGLRIFAFDDLEETKEAVRQRKIESTLVQQPYKMGYDAVSLLHDHFQGKTVPQQHITEITVLDGSAWPRGDGGGSR